MEPSGMKPAFNLGDEMAEIMESFLIETQEIFEALSQDLLKLEQHPQDAALHNTIFRAVHTVKGTSSFVGFEQMTELTHKFEDVLNRVRRGDLPVTSTLMDVMFEAFDLMKVLLTRIQAKNYDPVPIQGVVEKLGRIDEGSEGSSSSSSSPKESVEPVTNGEEEGGPPIVTPAEEKSVASVGPEGSGQLSVAMAKPVDSTIRVDVARLDNLMNLVGELVLGRNRLAQMASLLSQEQEGMAGLRELTETSSQIDFITTELQMAVMKTRMVPIGKVFNRLPRLIRDLSKEMGKEIRLVMNGEETELDKSIIEELNDPLIHILRNAADHGIEMPARRIERSKPLTGTVTVKAEQEGNHIVITIADDGKGMDPAVLKTKAVERGLITPQAAEEMTDTEALNLIFAPGFSTAERVTNVSGRGVGMDVVRTNISRLKGTIEIRSEIGAGSTFIIKLPLTLAIIQGLLVEANAETFAIPLASVLEVVRVQTSDIETINGREVIRLRSSVLPLARIADVMSCAHAAPSRNWLYVVLVGLAERTLGIVVEALLGQKEVVIKSLGSYLGNVRGIAGSTILGDGRVIMILDIGQFMALAGQSGAQRRSAA